MSANIAVWGDSITVPVAANLQAGAALQHWTETGARRADGQGRLIYDEGIGAESCGYACGSGVDAGEIYFVTGLVNHHRHYDHNHIAFAHSVSSIRSRGQPACFNCIAHKLF